MIELKGGQRYLVTTDKWFYAPNGNQYRAIWGRVQIVSDSILGIKTNSHSTNWYAVIGSDGKEVIVAGCQINYALRCEARPDDRPHQEWSLNPDKSMINFYDHPCMIYFAE